MKTSFQPLNSAVRWAVRGLAALVVLAHAALLWDRVRADELRDPEVAGRWLLSLAFVGVAWQLRRMGLLSFRGRRAMVFWLAVVLLHAAFLIPVGIEAEALWLVSPGWLAASVAWSASIVAATIWLTSRAIVVSAPHPDRRDAHGAAALPVSHGGFGFAWNDRGPPAGQ